MARFWRLVRPFILECRKHPWNLKSSRNSSISESRRIKEDLRSLLESTRFLPVSRKSALDILDSVEGVTRFSAAQIPLECFVFRGPRLRPLEDSLVHRVLARASAVLRLLLGCSSGASRGRSRLRIYIFPIEEPRFLPQPPISVKARKEYLAPRHINGGFYDSSVQSRESIVINRADEMPKVLLHEVLHHCFRVRSLSFSRTRVKKSRLEDFKRRLSIDQRTPLLIEEAIAETLAVVLQAGFVASESHAELQPSLIQNPRLTLAPVKLKFFKMLDREVKHCDALVQKAAAAYDWPRVPWRERTNFFAYVFLRSYIMMNYLSSTDKMGPDEAMEHLGWCIRSNPGKPMHVLQLTVYGSL